MKEPKMHLFAACCDDCAAQAVSALIAIGCFDARPIPLSRVRLDEDRRKLEAYLQGPGVREQWQVVATSLFGFAPFPGRMRFALWFNGLEKNPF